MTSRRRMPAAWNEFEDWRTRAACRGSETQAFFSPDRERGPSRARRERDAKAVCAACPVISQCLEAALMTPEPYGVWGGTTPEERQALLRRPA